MLRICLSFVLWIGLVSCQSVPPEPDATYFLVRHAEKLKDQADPGLTPEGHARAQALSELLQDRAVSKIYSSDYTRTRDTAQPLSEAVGIPLTLYNPRDLPGLAQTLESEAGLILVVGHSNTTPQLAGLLGIDPGEPIVEATEYDRLYIVERHGTEMTGKLTTYGE